MTIKDIKDRYNLTYGEMSELTGIPKRTLQAWVQGKREPAPYMAPMICCYIETDGGKMCQLKI